MSEAQLRRIERLNERIRVELEANHIPASQASKAIIAFTEAEPDPFISFAANTKNPYLKTPKKYNCLIM